MPSTTQLLASVEVTIKSLVIKRISSISINQPFDNHHSFEVSISPDMLPEKSLKVDIKKLAEQMVGEEVVIILKQGEKQKDGSISEKQKLNFKGFVSSVRLSKGTSSSNTIIISGLSPTALLSAGRTTRSFTEKNLDAIVNKVLSPFGSMSKKIGATYGTAIPFVTQYEEDNFHFLQRLAEDYGEWMLYDGENFIFGKNKKGPDGEVALKHGENIFDMQYSLRATPLNLKGFYYDYFTDKTYQAPSSKESVAGLGSYAQIGLEKSQKLFQDELIEIGYQNFQDTAPLAKVVRLKKSEQANKLAVLTGRTPEMQIKLGGTVKVTDTFINAENKSEVIDYGVFVVTKLSHYLDTRGVYQCNFEALPNNTDFAPVDYRIIQPNAEPQAAVVMQVDDEKSMGRVKVQFPWQKDDNEKTPWIRVVNSMAGKEQGVYFIPEVGEVVFVDFEFGNPDIPFVTGSMYHGQVLPGKDLFNAENNIKGIITRSGNHIIIDDTEGKEKIHIYNKDSKNEIELSLEGDKSIRIKSQGTIFIEAEKGIEMKAPKIKIEASEELNVKAGKTQIKSDQGTEISAGSSMDIKASVSGTFKASASLDLDGGGAASLKGGVVKIN
ncbi:type VI secretion system Vgr family protein [Dyadobacter sp. CY343]|uniref:type VI secretion system Vgr family protein n=1 Tax=Dyadobacter sp. CY343 TaxID=2907299 RepID=UPI001F32F3E0|nr:phage baseplate assembly protein V [Dyadobacter sp. CY343]MCE7059240.1 phage baseplate assembly protein V [Dyadobacter sp. CY343]